MNSIEIGQTKSLKFSDWTFHLYAIIGIPHKCRRNATQFAANLSQIGQIIWCRRYCSSFFVCTFSFQLRFYVFFVSAKWIRNVFNSTKMVFLPTHSSTRYSRSDCEDDSRFSFSNSSSPQLQSSNGGDNDVEEVSKAINETTFSPLFILKWSNL